MNGTIFWLHILSAVLSVLICGFLFLAGRSEKFRQSIGATERERAYNFQIVSVFLFSLGIELLSVPLEASYEAHLSTIVLVCVTGLIVVGMFVTRVAKRWI